MGRLARASLAPVRQARRSSLPRLQFVGRREQVIRNLTRTGGVQFDTIPANLPLIESDQDF